MAKKPDNTWVIHPYHLDLADSRIADDLTSRLDRPKFPQVIEADIVSPLLGTTSHAQEIDQPLLTAGKPTYGIAFERHDLLAQSDPGDRLGR